VYPVYHIFFQFSSFSSFSFFFFLPFSYFPPLFQFIYLLFTAHISFHFIFMNFLLPFSFTYGSLLYNRSPCSCYFFHFPFSIRPLSSKILFFQEILVRTAHCVTNHLNKTHKWSCVAGASCQEAASLEPSHFVTRPVSDFVEFLHVSGPLTSADL
jgi:hypothetical protein